MTPVEALQAELQSLRDLLDAAQDPSTGGVLVHTVLEAWERAVRAHLAVMSSSAPRGDRQANSRTIPVTADVADDSASYHEMVQIVDAAIAETLDGRRVK